MIDGKVRPLKDKLIEPVAAKLVFLNPSAMTLLAFGFGIASVVEVLRREFWWGLGFFVTYVVLDMLDGAVARKTKKVSDFGGFLDKNLDAIVFALVVVAFMAISRSYLTWLLGAVVLALYYVNIGQLFMLAAMVERRGVGNRLTSVEMPRGVVEAVETNSIYALMFLFPGQIRVWLGLMAVLMVATVVHRFWWAWRKMDARRR